MCIIDGIIEIIPQIFKSISEELNVLLNGVKSYRPLSEFDKKISR